MADTEYTRERTPQDYAIEHAGYMAAAARHLIECVNAEADARGAWEDAEDDGEKELREQTLDEKISDTSEALRTVERRIYEFEKRRDRAAALPSASLGEQREPNAQVPSNNYVQPVPDHCDRIIWRGFYYHLPISSSASPASKSAGPLSADQQEQSRGGEA